VLSGVFLLQCARVWERAVPSRKILGVYRCARVFHSRQWSNYNKDSCRVSSTELADVTKLGLICRTAWW